MAMMMLSIRIPAGSTRRCGTFGPNACNGGALLLTHRPRCGSTTSISTPDSNPTVIAALNVPSLQTAHLLPFALSLVMQKLAAPWQIIRLAIKMAASDDEIRVAATPYGIAVSIALTQASPQLG